MCNKDMFQSMHRKKFSLAVIRYYLPIVCLTLLKCVELAIRYIPDADLPHIYF